MAEKDVAKLTAAGLRRAPFGEREIAARHPHYIRRYYFFLINLKILNYPPPHLFFLILIRGKFKVFLLDWIVAWNDGRNGKYFGGWEVFKHVYRDTQIKCWLSPRPMALLKTEE